MLLTKSRSEKESALPDMAKELLNFISNNSILDLKMLRFIAANGGPLG
jgi:hypothetical protein